MVEIKYSINDIINSSITFLTPLIKAQEGYDVFIKIKPILSKSVNKKIFSSKKASLLKKDVIDNILLNSIWAISGIKNYKEFLKNINKKKNGIITIKTRKFKETSIIEIHDNGCGIKKEDLNKIFKKNFSTKTTKGLGLYFAKKAIDKIKGELLVESKIKKFTIITIKI